MTIGPGLPGATLEAFVEGFDTGQAGTLSVTIDDGDGNNIVGPTTANIVEVETVDGEGVYRYLGVFPSDPSLTPYLITWEGEVDGELTSASEEIEVSAEAPAAEAVTGPCTDWVTEEELVDCCSVTAPDSMSTLLADAITAAGNVLYDLSGELYPGLCGPVTVRPCKRGPGACATPGRWAGDPGYHCGCSPLSKVKLSNRVDVRAIAQVKIDGEVIAPSTYDLRDGRWLVRMRDPAAPHRLDRWPACQHEDLDDDQEGTFSVSFWYGTDPPMEARLAARELACEVARGCAGETCQLPVGVTRVTREGVTVDVAAITAWGRASDGTWRTGLRMVDMFLNVHNPTGHRRPATVWTPDMQQAAHRV